MGFHKNTVCCLKVVTLLKHSRLFNNVHLYHHKVSIILWPKPVITIKQFHVLGHMGFHRNSVSLMKTATSLIKFIYRIMQFVYSSLVGGNTRY